MTLTIKTSDLIGDDLDLTVAHCVEQSKPFPIYCDGKPMSKGNYSTDWSLAGPIIEREAIETAIYSDQWQATMHLDNGSIYERGPTPLIAAMRCYVASKLGDEVEMPEEVQS